MIDEDELLREIADLRVTELHRWIEQGWVMPSRRGSVYVYREIDVARVRLIVDMRRDLSVGEDTLPLVLSLMDQVYGLRRQLKRIAEAIDTEPDEVRRRIADRLDATRRD